MINAANQELQEFRVSGALAAAADLQDKALVLEQEVGLDNIYALLGMGHKLAAIANNLGVSLFDLEFMLKRTPAHTKKYLVSIIAKAGETSLGTLKHFDGRTSLEIDEVSAAKHHKGMVDSASRALDSIAETGGDNNIVVNNTIVVGDRSNVPELPDDLGEILDVTAG